MINQRNGNIIWYSCKPAKNCKMFGILFKVCGSTFHETPRRHWAFPSFQSPVFSSWWCRSNAVIS